MKNMKIKIRTAFVGIALLILTIGFSFESKAQLDPPPPDECVDPLDPACPIDGGLVFLIAAGIGIGAKNARRKN
jgi:uncharacterized membrane protein